MEIMKMKRYILLPPVVQEIWADEQMAGPAKMS